MVNEEGVYDNIFQYFHGVPQYLGLISWGMEIFLRLKNFTPPQYPALKMTFPQDVRLNNLTSKQRNKIADLCYFFTVIGCSRVMSHNCHKMP